jgi:hypothetical protein
LSIAEEVSAGVANAMGPIADHLVASVSKELRQTSKDILKGLSGKEIVLTIKLPNFDA